MKKLIPIIMLLPLLLASCGAQEDTGKLKVYSTFYAVNSLAEAIGGEDVVCRSIVPEGGEPHDFEPTASDMAKLAKADVFIYNGFGIDSWAQDVAESLPDAVTVVCASETIQPELDDPHVWLSPYYAQLQLEQICKALSTADKNNDLKYLSRLNDYSARIDALEEKYRAEGFEGEKLFVTHGAYGYLCADFGMEQVALEGISGGDVSPAQMAEIVDKIKVEGAKCIFYDPIEGSKTADAIAKEAGVEALPLYTFEGDSERRDYVTVMENNLELLKQGLK